MAGMAQQQHPQQHGAAAAAVECGSSPSSCVTADAGGQEARSSNSGGFHRGTSNGGGGAGTGAGAGAKKACGGNGLVALHHHQQQLHHHHQLQLQQQMASTTFVEADTSSFRELVQRLTGVAEDAAEKLPITLPSRHASREQREAMAAMYSGSSHFGSPREGLALMAPRSSSSNGNGGSHGQQQQEAAAAYAAVNWEKMIAGRNLPGGLNGLIDASAYNNSSSSSRGGIMNPGAVSGAGVSNTGTSFTPIATTKAAVEPLAVRRSAFKMPVGKKLELKQGSSSLRRDAVANAIFPNYHYWTTTGSGPGSSSSPRSAASPVTTLTRLPFESAHHLCSSAGSSVTSVSPRFGHDARYDGGGGGFSPRTPGSPYATPGTPTGFNIIDKRTRSLVHDVAHEFAGCNMADPAACSAAAAVPLPVPVPVPVRNGGSGGGSILQHSLLQRREEEEEEEYVVHPPLERRNGGQPQLLALFPMHSSSLKD